MQTSAPLQTLPSGQGVWSATGFDTQPVTGSQEPTMQTRESRQSGGVPGTHWPAALQTSFPLQRLPSGQGVPAGRKSQIGVQHWLPLGPSSHCSPWSTMPLPQSSRVNVQDAECAKNSL